MIRSPGVLRYTGTDLNFQLRNIGAGAGATGNIVPWRAATQFREVICTVIQDAGNASVITRITWIDWDGVTVIGAAQPWLNPGSTNLQTTLWCGGDNIRALSGTPATTTIPHILGAPYAQLLISNGDVAAHNFTMEVELIF